MMLFTRKELEERNHEGNAAVVIDNAVYDVTRFLDEHPGGAQILLDNAGGDASKCFRDVGHSEDAVLWRSEFKIGELVEEDQREEQMRTHENEAPQGWTLRGLADVATPPLALAALAVVAYAFLFS